MVLEEPDPQVFRNAHVEMTLERTSRGAFIVTIVPHGKLHLTADVVRANNALIVENSPPRFKTLIDGREVRSMSSDARRAAADPVLDERTICLALIVGGPITAAIANFFVFLVKPAYPLRLFHDPDVARRWVVDFREAP